MAKIPVNIFVNIEIPEPKSLEKQTLSERNAYIKEVASERILDALNIAELNPSIKLIRVGRLPKGEKTDE
jgi:hypothetical protein